MLSLRAYPQSQGKRSATMNPLVTPLVFKSQNLPINVSQRVLCATLALSNRLAIFW